jgi:hypothetical protein
MWEVATTEEFDGWFAGLSEDAQAEVIAKVELLRLLGPRLGRPHAGTLKNSKHSNMEELRADGIIWPSQIDFRRVVMIEGLLGPLPPTVPSCLIIDRAAGVVKLGGRMPEI